MTLPKKISLDVLNHSQGETFDFEKAYRECFVDVDKPVEKPPIAMGIGHDWQGNLNPTFTYGESSVLIAPKKSKKTFFKTALASCYIGGNAQNYFPDIITTRKKDLYVLDFDTEQGNYYAPMAFKRVGKMVGFKYENYLPFSIKKLSKKDRLMFIDMVIERYKGKIGIVFIDGVKDLIVDPNSQSESDRIIEYQEKWTGTGLHLCEVIHKTFEKDKAFGSIGTKTQDKGETSIFLESTRGEKEDEKNQPIKVFQRDARGSAFKTFYFDLDLQTLIPKECEPVKW
jgi:hypothetical protein